MRLSTTAQSFMALAIAPSTSQRYATCLKKYISFCNQLNLQVFPLHEQNMILFTTHMATSSSYSNIKVHLAAIKFFADIHGHNPYNNSSNHLHRLYLVLRGIRRVHGSKYKRPKRAPITPTLLKVIHRNLFNSSTVYEDKLMLWAAMLTAFFGFLRISEYTSSHVKSYDPQVTLCFEDVKKCPNRSISVNIKASKTDPFSTIIQLSPNYSVLCPILALEKYLTIHPTKQGPVFTMHNGKYLTRNKIGKVLENYLPFQQNISTHSFRIGAATTAAAAGHPRWLIQAMGRWNSDCFRQYIRIPAVTLYKVSTSMTKEISNNTPNFDPDNCGN